MSKARKILNSENANNGKISNHSARKTTITKLLNENINPLLVQQISGHKKLQSLNQYNTAYLSIQKQVSNVISTGKSSSETSLESSLPLHIQKQMMQSWNPRTPIFQGATLSNCIFNININTTPSSPQNFNIYIYIYSQRNASRKNWISVS